MSVEGGGTDTRVREDMDEDDSAAEAVLMAAAATSISRLQSMSHTLGDLLRSGPGGGAVDVARGTPGVWWDDSDEESGQQEKTRESRPRPDYNASAWGLRLQMMEELRTTNRLDPDCREAKAFRSDFRVPYEFFLTFVEMVRPVFPSSARDITGRDCVPLELKVLGALQVLGRGNCFADVANFSGMSRTTAEKSFHRFCDCFSAGLWHQWVRLPEGADLERVEGIYRDLGFPGAVGLTDCTHVAWERCAFSETNNHKGKEGFTSVVFEVTSDHTGRIIASTRGYPGAENDKTVIKRDLSVIRIRDNDPWASYKYELRGLDGTVTEHTGGWLIVDGGYHRVPLLICPMKAFANDEDMAWSTRLESVRKDIECVFGRLKGRFRLFKTGILFSTREKIDNAWFTACIIHNMLLQHDGLDKLEKDMDWAGKDGMAGERTGVFPPETDVGDMSPGTGEATYSFNEFRKQLVDHFTFENKGERICWFKVA